jgi:hypothetical protein
LISDLLDVEPQQAASWLNGEAYPKTSALVKLAQIAQVRSNWLLSGTGEKYTNDIEREATRKRIMNKHGKASSYELSHSEAQDLSQDALLVASAYMKLPPQQREHFKNLILSMAKHH